MLYESGTSELTVMGSNVIGGQARATVRARRHVHTARVTGHRCWFLGRRHVMAGIDPARDIDFGDLELSSGNIRRPPMTCRLSRRRRAAPPATAEPEPEPLKCRS